MWTETRTELPPGGMTRNVFFPGLLMVVLAAMSLFPANAMGQSPSATEYQVKAAFLYNFAKFVEWPPGSFPNASAPLQICVWGRDPFGQELQDVTHEKIVNGHPLEVNHVVDLPQARSCHVLFIPFSEKAQMKMILEGLRGASVLTVGDTRDFAARGGMINFVLDDDRVKFEVNRRAAEEAGLKISSKLLGVARLVIG